MGKPMYNFGKQAKEKARQQKQMEKVEKRMKAKQQKANLNTNTQDSSSVITDPGLIEEAVKSIA